MNSIKPLVAGVLAASLVFSPLAQARISLSKSSSSHSYSSSSYSSSSSQSNTSRLGGGSSVGMSRSDVMNNVRNGGAPTSYGSSSGASNYGAPAGGYAQPGAPRSGPGWGTVAGAAVAAGAAGYMLGHNNNPTYVPANAGGVGGTPAYVAPASSGGFSFGSLLLWGLIIAGGIWLVRRVMGQQVQAKPVLAPLPPIGGNMGSGFGGGFQNSGITQQADAIFRDMQDINNSGNRDQLRAFCTPEVFQQLQGNMGGSTRILSLRSQVVDDSGGLVSVRYQGSVSENGGAAEDVDEVWHFMHNRNPGEREWLLAGIEQV